MVKVQSQYRMISLICFDILVNLIVVALVYLRISNLFLILYLCACT